MQLDAYFPIGWFARINVMACLNQLRFEHTVLVSEPYDDPIARHQKHVVLYHPRDQLVDRQDRFLALWTFDAHIADLTAPARLGARIPTHQKWSGEHD
jgi:hypothetical protein